MQETVLESNLKIERATEGLARQAVRRLTEHAHKPNALSIHNFLLDCRVESNISSTLVGRASFSLYARASNYVGKNFKEFSREHVPSFLDSYRKTEPKDPLHGWM